MQEIIDFLHCTMHYTVQNKLHFVLWKQVYYFQEAMPTRIQHFVVCLNCSVHIQKVLKLLHVRHVCRGCPQYDFALRAYRFMQNR